MRRLTGDGVDVAIEALGTQETFESCLQCLRPGGVLSSLGVYSGKLAVPYKAFGAGLADYQIVTTLCPGGKDRMRRLMALVRHGRLDLTPLITHRFSLDRIADAYELFASRRDGVIKVAITQWTGCRRRASEEANGEILPRICLHVGDELELTG